MPLNEETEINQKKKTTEFLKLNVRMFNTLSRAKYETLQSQKKSTEESPERIIWTFSTIGSLGQTTYLLIKNSSEE